MKILTVMGELRRAPFFQGEFSRCGEEYIPYHLFKEIKGTIMYPSNKFRIIEKNKTKIIQYPKIKIKGPLRTFFSDLQVRNILKKTMVVNHI